MLYLAACIIVAIVASKRGRSSWIFFLCTLTGGFLLAIIVAKIGSSFWAGVWAFLSPIIGFVVALASETGQEMAVQRGEYGGYKKCPFCAEPVRREAIKCKHCGSELPPAESGPSVLSGGVGGDVTQTQTGLAERYSDPSKLEFLCPNCDTDIVGDEAECYKCGSTLNAVDGWRPVPKAEQ